MALARPVPQPILALVPAGGVVSQKFDGGVLQNRGILRGAGALIGPKEPERHKRGFWEQRPTPKPKNHQPVGGEGRDVTM